MAQIIQLIIQGVNMGLLYALAALAVSLIWNASGLFNFSQGDLLVLGGFAMITLYSFQSLPYILAAILSIVTMGILGYLLSMVYFYPMFRDNMSGQIITIGTVAISIFIRNCILLIWGPNSLRYDSPFGTEAFIWGEFFIMPHYIWNIVIVAVLVVALQIFLRGTVIGIAMRAVAQKPVAASLMGVKVEQMVCLTFLLSTALATISGILVVPIIPLGPETGGALATKAFASVLIGGLGSFAGAMVGGLIVGIGEIMFASFVTTTYKDLFTFVVLILFLLFRPGGIFRASVADKV